MNEALMLAVMSRIAGQLWGMDDMTLARLMAHHLGGDARKVADLKPVRALRPEAVAAGTSIDGGVQLVKDDGGSPLYVRAGSVAVFQLTGILDTSDEDVSFVDWWSGERVFFGTSYQRYLAATSAAAADSKVRSGLTNVDSPGGNAMTMEIGARAVRQFKASGKEMVALTNHLNASAALFASSQANKLYTTPGGWTGSIGVMANYFNYAAMFEKMGIKVETLKNPPHKDAGSPFREMTAGDRALLQKDVDKYYAMFRQYMAEGRGVDDKRVQAWIDARGLIGTDAVDAGLVDGVVNSLADLVGMLNNGGGRVSVASVGRAERANAPAAAVQVAVDAGGAGGGTDMLLKAGVLAAVAGSVLMDPKSEGGGGGGGGAPTATAPDPNALRLAVAEGVKNENDRQAAINVCADLFPELDGIKGMRDKAIADTTVSADKFRAEVLAKVAAAKKPVVQVPEQNEAANSGGGVQVGADRRKRGLELALMARACGCVGTVTSLMAGVAVADPTAQQMGFESGRAAVQAFADMRSAGLRGLTAMEIASAYLVATGKYTEAEVAAMRGEPEGHRFMAALTTSDFPKVLENVQNKTLNTAIALQQFVWSKFCAVRSVKDYKTISIYSTSGLGNLDLNPEGAPAQLTSMNEKRETGSVKKYAKKVALTWEMLKNDDLGAFGDIVLKMLQAAARVPEQLFFAVLTAGAGLGPLLTSDNARLIDATHNNAGPGAALSYAAVQSDRRAFLKKTGFGPDGATDEYLDVAPKLLLTSVDLSDTARNICLQEWAPGATGAQLERNILRGLLEPVTSPRLGQTTRRWLFADPNECPVLAMYFLDGQQNAVIHSIPGTNPYAVEQQVTMPGVGCFVVGFEGIYSDAGV